MEEVDEIARRPNSIPISCSLRLNMDGLLERIWDMMALVRVYTKKVGVWPASLLPALPHWPPPYLCVAPCPTPHPRLCFASSHPPSPSPGLLPTSVCGTLPALTRTSLFSNLPPCPPPGLLPTTFLDLRPPGGPQAALSLSHPA
jgi:hypothetical protein